VTARAALAVLREPPRHAWEVCPADAQLARLVRTYGLLQVDPSSEPAPIYDAMVDARFREALDELGASLGAPVSTRAGRS